MDNPNPSTLDKLAAIAGKVAIIIPGLGPISVGLEALAALIDHPDTDKSALTNLDTEYKARIAAREAQAGGSTEGVIR